MEDGENTLPQTGEENSPEKTDESPPKVPGRFDLEESITIGMTLIDTPDISTNETNPENSENQQNEAEEQKSPFGKRKIRSLPQSSLS